MLADWRAAPFSDVQNLELKEVNNARKKAIADKEAAELTTRRLQAAWKDHDDTALLAAKAAVEDQLKLAEKEVSLGIHLRLGVN